MSITISDPALLEQLRQGSGSVELTDPQGKLIGTLTLAVSPPPPPEVKPPFTEEELAELRKDRTGRPLADILRDLEAQP